MNDVKAIVAFLILGIVIAMLCGCASAPAPLPDRVLVPVPADCKSPVIPARPDLPIADLNPTSAPDVVVRAYAATVEILMGRIEALEALLTPNTQPSTATDSH